MKSFKKIQKFLSSAPLPPGIYTGAAIETAAPVLLKLALTHDLPVVTTLPDAKAVDLVADELDAWLKLLQCDLRILTIPECGRGKLLFPGGEAHRARALNNILNHEYDLILGSVHSLLGPAPDPEESSRAQLELHPGDTIAPAELLARLVTMDYDDEALVTISGEFSRRGGIVDIFSPAHDEPCRIEFFGDEIDSMRFFSPETQRSTGKAESYRIINRAGITAGGAAESDAFAYLEKLPGFVLVDVDPDSGGEILKKYSVPGAPEHWEQIRTT